MGDEIAIGPHMLYSRPLRAMGIATKTRRRKGTNTVEMEALRFHVVGPEETVSRLGLWGMTRFCD